MNMAQLTQSLATSLEDNDAALLVSSNGILRFFLRLVPGAFEALAENKELKVATGNCCALRQEGGVWSLVFWNRLPQRLGLA